MKLRKCSEGSQLKVPQFTKSDGRQQTKSEALPQLEKPQQKMNNATTKIIQSYEQLLKSLNQKIQQLTADLQLTRQKLTISQTRYATLLNYMNNDDKIDMQKLVDKIDELQKKLISKNSQLIRCKSKLLSKKNLLQVHQDNQKSKQENFVERINIGSYFNFECIRQNQSIINRNRKNSSQQQEFSTSWERAFQNFADETSSPTKFKQKTIGILKKFIPFQQRRKVWPYVFQNQLGLTNQLYVQLMERRSKNIIQSQVISQIERDIIRSFNSKMDLKNKQALIAQVRQILQIFHLFRPDISYVQGMTYPVIILTVIVGKVEAFKIFTNLVICNKFFRNMYSVEEKSVQIYSRNLPNVAKHLQQLQIKPQIFLIQWFFTIFSRGLSLQTTLKIWDLLGYEKEVVLYRLSLSIFQLIGKRIMAQNYEQTVGLIQSYWSYIDENKLLELTVNNKLTIQKLSRTLAKVTRQVYDKEKQSQKTL